MDRQTGALVGRVWLRTKRDDGRSDAAASYGAVKVNQMKRAGTEIVEDFELAMARLEWARTAGCLDLPSQREALEWHIARCEEALSAIDREATDRDDT